jgi:hypothetical protein
MKREIVETMLVLQVRFMREARGAQIDAGDARFPVIEGIARGGVAAATRDQDVEILPVRPIGPERVPVAFEIAPVPPRPHVRSIEVGDGKRIHPFLVLAGDRAELGCRFDQRPLPLRQRRSAPMTAVYPADREFVQPAPADHGRKTPAVVPQARRQHNHRRREGREVAQPHAPSLQ